MALPRWITKPVGVVSQQVGGAYDYLTPGAGKSTLTNAGDAIVDPNRVFTGSLNPFDSSYNNGGRGNSSQGSGFVTVNPTPQASGGNKPAGSNPQVQGAQTVAGNYVADPYAEFGGKAAYDAKRATFGATQAGYRGGAETGLRDVTNTYGDKSQQFANEIEQGQGDLNRGFATNELNLRRSMQNIVRGIQQGIRSGGVALAGMNASDSGASDALARAYARSGNQQTGEARGEAATQAEELQRQQGQLNVKRNQGEQGLGTWRDTETNRVRSDFGNKLDLLDAQAQGQGFGGVVDRSMVDAVLGNALAQLQQIDAQRQQRMQGVQQWTPEQIMAEAIRMDEAGQAGDTFQTTGPEVNYGMGIPLAGAPLGELPIFVRGRDDQRVA